MRLKTAVALLRKHTDQSQAEFGAAIGVGATAVFFWEKGRGVSPYNRMRLLGYARRVSAPPDVVAALEAQQPESAHA